MSAIVGPIPLALSTDRVWWMPSDGALHGLAIDRLMWWNLVVLSALFVLAHILLIAAAFRSRRHPALGQNIDSPLPRHSDDQGRACAERSRRKESIQSTHSRNLSNVSAAIGKSELILLFALTLLYTWMAISAQRLWATIRYQGAAPQALQVEVTGEQFQWYFRYPGADAAFGLTRPELINAPAGNPLGLDRTDPHSTDDIVSSILVLPAGREVDLNLRSIDVIHGFFIPGMRLKQNAVPGMPMHVHFTPSIPGDYAILCSQVCGLGHARMQTHLRVVPNDAYLTWLNNHAPKPIASKPIEGATR
jgi:cytochrome c oxidase subunit 2